METFVDTTAPPITGLYADGGADLFRDQSQCPFRAFARHRLHSRELAEADIGLDAAQRGTLLHQLMEKIWSQLESRDKLADHNRGRTGAIDRIPGTRVDNGFPQI